MTSEERAAAYGEGLKEGTLGTLDVLIERVGAAFPAKVPKAMVLDLLRFMREGAGKMPAPGSADPLWEDDDKPEGD